MDTYIAYVRVPFGNSGSTTVVKAVVQAEGYAQAMWLLEGQYGSGNIVHFPQLA